MTIQYIIYHEIAGRKDKYYSTKEDPREAIKDFLEDTKNNLEGFPDYIQAKFGIDPDITPVINKLVKVKRLQSEHTQCDHAQGGFYKSLVNGQQEFVCRTCLCKLNPYTLLPYYNNRIN